MLEPERRSGLVQYRVIIIICLFSVTTVSTLYNIFGMNLGLDAAWRLRYPVFLETVIVSILGGILITALLLWYCRRHRIVCY